MNRLVCIGFLASLMAMESSHAFLGGVLKRSGEKKVLSAEELNTQQSKAEQLLARAREQEQAGRLRQARDAYKSISQNYPRTEAGAEALYGYGRMLEAEGNARKAFEQYQELIKNHRNTANFNEVVQRQFQIAESLRTSDKKGFLGIGASIQPSKLVEMFTQISENAPYTDWAPKALLNIGYVRSDNKEVDPAIASFKQVVDKYPDTEFAKEAQYQIFKLRGVTAEKSNSPLKNRAQVEAGLDFLNHNPDDQRAAEVRSDMQQIENQSMEKLYNTGMFYEKRGEAESARVYYREVVKNPNTPWAAKAQERLSVIDAGGNIEKKASMFGPAPLRKNKLEMRTSDDGVVPLPVEDSSSAGRAPATSSAPAP